jgi:uncharacterized protein Yka (UPF0111/DUF47 family)
VKLSLVPQERRLYDLFRRQGGLASDTLAELSKSLLEGRSRQARMHELEHRCDEVTAEIYTLANRRSTAPIARGDIVALASAMDDVVDLAEEAGARLELYRVGVVTEPARELGEVLALAGVELARALGRLDPCGGQDAHRAEIHRLEGEADRIYRQALAELFAEDATPAAELVKWKDLYDLLEQTIDKCKSVANLLFTICLESA